MAPETIIIIIVIIIVVHSNQVKKLGEAQLVFVFQKFDINKLV